MPRRDKCILPTTWDVRRCITPIQVLQSCMGALCKRELKSRAFSLRFNHHTVGVQKRSEPRATVSLRVPSATPLFCRVVCNCATLSRQAGRYMSTYSPSDCTPQRALCVGRSTPLTYGTTGDYGYHRGKFNDTLRVGPFYIIRDGFGEFPSRCPVRTEPHATQSLG